MWSADGNWAGFVDLADICGDGSGSSLRFFRVGAHLRYSPLTLDAFSKTTGKFPFDVLLTTMMTFFKY